MCRLTKRRATPLLSLQNSFYKNNDDACLGFGFITSGLPLLQIGSTKVNSKLSSVIAKGPVYTPTGRGQSMTSST